MANSDIPNGFRVVGTLDGSDYHGKQQRVCFLATDATATFLGDAVKITGSGSADGTSPSVAQCAAGDRLYGYLTGLEPDFTDESSLSSANYRAASTLRYGTVVIADDAICTIQEDSVGGNLAVTNIGQNISIIVGSGSTVTGASGMELDSSTAATTNTLIFRVLGLDETQGNAVGTNARWRITANLTNLNNIAGV
jgi:hypothetical protein